jgi:hypothetical protein
MKMTVKVEGMDDLKKTMLEVLEEMKQATGDGADACAERLAVIVRRNAPDGPPNPKRGAGLKIKNNVITKKLPDKPGYPSVTMVGIDAKVGHQHIVEFGTGPRWHTSGKSVGTMPASGFFRKSIDEGRQQIAGIMQTHCRKPIERRGGR